MELNRPQKDNLVVLSVPENTNDWIIDKLREPSFTRYLRETRAVAEIGACWTEIVGRGCGIPEEIVLRVEKVENDNDIGDRTEFDFILRSDPELS
ncbi:hypothetical protein GWK26_09995 [haloarchaeon 3A1-DGR]|nr:hypothetical protein GWK26_09995 [haloarchaeon 3A1-DGR]